MVPMRLFLRFLLGIAILVLVLGTLFFIKGTQFAAMGAQTPPPAVETVTVTMVQEMEWEVGFNAVGTLSAVQGVVLEVEFPGIVREINFENGQAVQKGDVLLRLDTRTEQAELEAALASVELAQVEFERAESLVASAAAPQSQLDLRRAELRRARAAVETIEAIIDRKTITAPFDGITGIRQINVGQFVNAGTRVVTLQNFQPIFVDFSLPQQELASVTVGDRVRVTTDGLQGRAFEGVLTAIDPQVNPRNRMVRLQATLSNEDDLLRPGMFAQVRVVAPERRRVAVIPQTSVLPATFGNSVFAVVPATARESGAAPAFPVKAEQKFIRLGERRGDFIEVLDGLQIGETVVALGAFKLRNGVFLNVSENGGGEPALQPSVLNR
jgi:membrane fusion protein (multidrug efflux system)